MLGELLNRAQRNYPSGRVSADDEGETAFAIAVDHAHRIIRIHFTKPMEWLGFDLASARHLRSLLNEKIQELEAADVPLEKGR